MSKSDKNKDAMRRSGIIPVMAKLLTSVHEDVVSSIMGIIVNCATQVGIVGTPHTDIGFYFNCGHQSRIKDL